MNGLMNLSVFSGNVQNLKRSVPMCTGASTVLTKRGRSRLVDLAVTFNTSLLTPGLKESMNSLNNIILNITNMEQNTANEIDEMRHTCEVIRQKVQDQKMDKTKELSEVKIKILRLLTKTQQRIACEENNNIIKELKKLEGAKSSAQEMLSAEVLQAEVVRMSTLYQEEHQRSMCCWEAREICQFIKHRQEVLHLENQLNNMKERQKDSHNLVQTLKLELQESMKKHEKLPSFILNLAAAVENGNADNNLLIQLVKDIYSGTKNHHWSDSIKTLYAMILDYGGPAVHDVLRQNLGGPSVSTSYARAIPDKKYGIPMKFTEKQFQNAKSYFEKQHYSGPLHMSVDATAIVPGLRVRDGLVYGFTHGPVVVDSHDDIVTMLQQYEKANQVYAFILSPMVDRVKPFVVAMIPVQHGETSDTVAKWRKDILNSNTQSLPILGFGADGDSKVRKHWEYSFSDWPDGGPKPDSARLIDHPGFTFHLNSKIECTHQQTQSITNTDNQPCEMCLVSFALPFPDPFHMFKKLRNQLLNCRRFLIIGEHKVMLENIIDMYNSHKIESGLWKTDVWVKDRQNVNAALRLFSTRCVDTLGKWNRNVSLGTRVYLEHGNMLIKLFNDKDLSLNQRIYYAWRIVIFMRFWRSWLQTHGFTMEQYFISNQCYKDLMITCHSFILTVKLLNKFYPNIPLTPWCWGSDNCERLFANIRCFVRGKMNMCLTEMLDVANRLQHIQEISLNDTSVKDRHGNLCKKMPHTELPSDPLLSVMNEQAMSEMIVSEMKKAEKDAVALVSKLGIAGDLACNGFLHKQLLPSGKVCYELNDRHRKKLGHQDSDVHYNEKDIDEVEEYAGPLNDTEDDVEIDQPLVTQEELIATTIANNKSVVFSEQLQDMVLNITANTGYSVSDFSAEDDVVIEGQEDIYITGDEPDGDQLSSSSQHSRRHESKINQYIEKDASSNDLEINYIYHNGQWHHKAALVAAEDGKVYIPTMSRQNRFFRAYDIRYSRNMQPLNNSAINKTVTRGDVIIMWKHSRNDNPGQIEFCLVHRIVVKKGKSLFPTQQVLLGDKGCHYLTSQTLAVTNLTATLVPNSYVCINSDDVIKMIKTERGANGSLTIRAEDIDDLDYIKDELLKKEKLNKMAAKKKKAEEEESRRKGPVEKMNVNDLKVLLKEIGVKGYSKMNKPALIQKLKEERAKISGHSYISNTNAGAYDGSSPPGKAVLYYSHGPSNSTDHCLHDVKVNIAIF